MNHATLPDFLTQDAFRSLLPPDPSLFMISLVDSCFDGMAVAQEAWQFPLSSRDVSLDANDLVHELRARPVSIALSAIEPVTVDVCQPYEMIEPAIAAARMLFIRFATVTLALSYHLERTSERLRRLGSVEQFSGRMIGFELLMQSNLAILRRIAADDATLSTMLEARQLPNEGVFAEIWQGLLDRYGHRAENETDLAAPRYAEQPDVWIQTITSAKTSPHYPAFPRRSIRGAITFPIWRAALRYLYASGQFRHSTMYAFAHLRNELLRLAEKAAAQGKLEGKNSIWSMTVSEVMALDERN